MVRLATAFQVSPQKDQNKNKTPNPGAMPIVPKNMSTTRSKPHPQQITPVNLMNNNYLKKITSTTQEQTNDSTTEREFVLRMKNEDIRFAVECICCFIVLWILLMMSNKISKLQSQVHKLTNAILDMKRGN